MKVTLVSVVGKEDVEDEDAKDDVIRCEEVDEDDVIEDVGCCVVDAGCKTIKAEIPAAATMITIMMRAAEILVIAFNAKRVKS